MNSKPEKGNSMASQQNVEAPIAEYMLIGGRRVDGPHRIEVRNPARPDELVGTIVRGSPEHVNQAVAAAKTAQPSWAAETFAARATVLASALARWRMTSSAAPPCSSAKTASRWLKRAENC
jgi:delta 1-pyrroline-5-carboxylate dehydrogenase